MRRTGVIWLAALAAVVALVAAGCSGGAREEAAKAAPEPRCPTRALPGWQRLANRIHAPVYCPAWMPDPLDGVIGSRWSNIDSVSKDRSYLESWVWQETGPGAAGGELHVNLRGYPGRTGIPRCVNADSKKRELIPCFSDARGRVRINGITATVYTVNQDADQWHVLYAWRRGGSLYTISQHVAPPLGYRGAIRTLDRMLRNLVLVKPS